MKRSKFNEAQVAFILRQADEDATVSKVGGKKWVSVATFFVWSKKYSGRMTQEVKRLRQLEEKHARLKLTVADLLADKEMQQYEQS